MPTWTGSFNSSGSPTIKIRVYGISEQSAQEFEAIVDTGFTGFISMPAVQAFPLGLVLAGTATTILADGSQSPKLMAYGNVAVGQEKQVGTILLNLGASDILVGTEFLTAFRKSLFIYERIVALFDNAEVKQFIESMMQAAQRAAQAAATAASEIRLPHPLPLQAKQHKVSTRACHLPPTESIDDLCTCGHIRGGILRREAAPRGCVSCRGAGAQDSHCLNCRTKSEQRRFRTLPESETWNPEDFACLALTSRKDQRP
jgi:predicted aspartyl protease